MGGNTITHQVAITFIHDKFNELFKHFLLTQRKKNVSTGVPMTQKSPFRKT